MGIGESYRDHLAGKTDRTRLERDLGEAGLHLEARMFGVLDDGQRNHIVTDPSSWMLGRRLWSGPLPPSDAGAGDIWFDPYELAAMVLCPHPPLHVDGPPPQVDETFDPRLAWLATRPVLHFQFSAFLELAPLERGRWEGPDDLGLFDPGRFAAPPSAPVTDVARGEAHLYARWFGKSLPSVLVWTAARTALPLAGFSSLWRSAGREWISTSPVVDPEIGVVVSEADVDIDPDALEDGDDGWLTSDAHECLFGPWERASDVGFRTAVTTDIGLLTPRTYERALVADVRLRSPLSRRGADQ